MTSVTGGHCTSGMYANPPVHSAGKAEKGGGWHAGWTLRPKTNETIAPLEQTSQPKLGETLPEKRTVSLGMLWVAARNLARANPDYGSGFQSHRVASSRSRTLKMRSRILHTCGLCYPHVPTRMMIELKLNVDSFKRGWILSSAFIALPIVRKSRMALPRYLFWLPHQLSSTTQAILLCVCIPMAEFIVLWFMLTNSPMGSILSPLMSMWTLFKVYGVIAGGCGMFIPSPWPTNR